MWQFCFASLWVRLGWRGKDISAFKLNDYGAAMGSLNQSDQRMPSGGFTLLNAYICPFLQVCSVCLRQRLKLVIQKRVPLVICRASLSTDVNSTEAHWFVKHLASFIWFPSLPLSLSLPFSQSVLFSCYSRGCNLANLSHTPCMRLWPWTTLNPTDLSKQVFGGFALSLHVPYTFFLLLFFYIFF